MDTENPPFGEFGGIAGRVLREAMSPGTWLTGITVSVAIFVCVWILDAAGAGDAAGLVFPVFTAVALARFALNGLAGEWRGTLFSSPGGSWVDVGLVSVRFLALNAVWLIPVLILGWRPEQTGQAIGSLLMGMGGNKMLSLTTLVGSAAALTPPLLLIGAVSAMRWPDLWSRTRWMQLFEDRWGDLFLVYVVYLGGLAMTMALLFPVLTALLFQSAEAAKFFGLAGMAYACGLSVTLLGRLCGFFAATSAGPLGTLTEEEAFSPTPVTPISVLPRRESAGPGPSPSGETASRTADGDPPAAGGQTAAEGRAPAPSRQELHVVGGAGDPKMEIKALLMNAGERVDAVLERCRRDPEGALSELEYLRDNHRPNPRVMHALCLVQAQLGWKDESLESAKEALPHCLERGAIRPAAEIYALHLDRASVFELSSWQALEFADALRQGRRFPQAEAVYRSLLGRDPDTGRVVKGLLQVADGYIHDSVDLEQARNLYRFLLEKSGDSPLAIHMREGLAEAERRIAQAS